MALAKVILLADRSRPNVENIVSQLENGLSDVAQLLPEGEDHFADATLAIAIGGDGTLIHHGRIVSSYDIPLIGVNSGHLGFLAKFHIPLIFAFVVGEQGSVGLHFEGRKQCCLVSLRSQTGLGEEFAHNRHHVQKLRLLF